MKVLITGSSGFVGTHVLEMAHELDRLFDVKLVLPVGQMDLCRPESVNESIGPCKFDAVLHLAAQSSVPESFSNPQKTFTVNVLGTVNLLSHLVWRGFAGRLLYVSTGDVYGLVGVDQLPVNELSPVRPGNPYAASKLAAEAAVLAWERRRLFEALVARPFNHIGPGQSEAFAVARFAGILSRIKRGNSAQKLTTGRLDVTRDFLDVRDVVMAYFGLLKAGHTGEIYNVCSGTERALQYVLDALIALSGTLAKPIPDPSLLRPVELVRMVGSADKLRSHTGWRPSIDFEKTLSDLFHYYMNGPLS